MPKVYILSDFDGTITPTPGSETVFTKFYRSLLVNDDKKNYVEAKLKDNVQAIFKAEFGDKWPNKEYQGHFSNLLIPEKTITALHQLLALENVNFRIITKNRPDYVQALMRYHGFSEEEISKIEFRHGNKKDAVMDKSIIPTFENDADVNVWVLDDNFTDLVNMAQALEIKGYLQEDESKIAFSEEIELQKSQVRLIKKKEGQFNWNAILSSVKATVQPDTSPELDNEQKEQSGHVGALAKKLTGQIPLGPTSAAQRPTESHKNIEKKEHNTLIHLTKSRPKGPAKRKPTRHKKTPNLASSSNTRPSEPNPSSTSSPNIKKESTNAAQDIQSLLEKMDLANLMAKFTDLKKEMPEGSEDHRALDVFIEGVEDAKQSWEKNPTQRDAFIESCQKLVDNAQKSSLKNHTTAIGLFTAFKQAINWLAFQFGAKEPVFKLQTYQDLSMFQNKVEEAQTKETPKDKPTP